MIEAYHQLEYTAKNDLTYNIENNMTKSNMQEYWSDQSPYLEVAFDALGILVEELVNLSIWTHEYFII